MGGNVGRDVHGEEAWEMLTGLGLGLGIGEDGRRGEEGSRMGFGGDKGALLPLLP